MFKQPGDKRGCGCFAVGARHHNGAVMGDQVASNQLRHGEKLKMMVQGIFEFRVSTAYRIADNDEIR